MFILRTTRDLNEKDPVGNIVAILDELKGTSLGPITEDFSGFLKETKMCLSCGESRENFEKRGVMALQLPLTKRSETLEDGISRVLKISSKICDCGGKVATVRKFKEYPKYLLLDVQAFQKVSLKVKDWTYNLTTLVQVQGMLYGLRAIVTHKGETLVHRVDVNWTKYTMESDETILIDYLQGTKPVLILLRRLKDTEAKEKELKEKDPKEQEPKEKEQVEKEQESKEQEQETKEQELMEQEVLEEPMDEIVFLRNKIKELEEQLKAKPAEIKPQKVILVTEFSWG